ncbi:Hypothetical predicted protein [Paramuricea clavata]|uniref:Uncharacterized protein n=1 Tax=Paramuricea clavata TaxID=317549 RepID=A0A6S7FFD8_PARCT|nr:Hypothetical predicted protein [Paramuricea clavata]
MVPNDGSLKSLSLMKIYEESLLGGDPNNTKLLVFATRYMLKQIPADPHIFLLGKKLFPVTSVADLGMTLDSGLTYDEHVTKLVSSCVGSLCQINRARHVFDMKTLILLINALVF